MNDRFPGPTNLTPEVDQGLLSFAAAAGNRAWLATHDMDAAQAAYDAAFEAFERAELRRWERDGHDPAVLERDNAIGRLLARNVPEAADFID